MCLTKTVDESSGNPDDTHDQKTEKRAFTFTPTLHSTQPLVCVLTIDSNSFFS